MSQAEDDVDGRPFPFRVGGGERRVDRGRRNTDCKGEIFDQNRALNAAVGFELHGCAHDVVVPHRTGGRNRRSRDHDRARNRDKPAPGAEVVALTGGLGRQNGAAQAADLPQDPDRLIGCRQGNFAQRQRETDRRAGSNRGRGREGQLRVWIEFENLERVCPAEDKFNRRVRGAEVVGAGHGKLKLVVARRTPLRNRNRNRLQRHRRRDRNIDQRSAGTVLEAGALAGKNAVKGRGPARRGRSENAQRIDHLAVLRRVRRQMPELQRHVDRSPRLLRRRGRKNGRRARCPPRDLKIEILRQQRLDRAARGQLHAHPHNVTAVRAQLRYRARHRLRARNRRQIGRLTQ